MILIRSIRIWFEKIKREKKNNDWGRNSKISKLFDRILIDDNDMEAYKNVWWSINRINRWIELNSAKLDRFAKMMSQKTDGTFKI